MIREENLQDEVGIVVSRGNAAKKYRVVFLLCAVSIILAVLFTYTRTFDYAFSESKIDLKDIITIKTLGDEVFVLYRQISPNGIVGLGACKFTKSDNMWKISYQTVKPDMKYGSIDTVFYSETKDKVLMYGSVEGEDVKEIKAFNNGKYVGNADLFRCNGVCNWLKEVTTGSFRIEPVFE